MSASIWTQCGARSNLRRLRATAWRVVEAQHLVSTRRLVDSVDEQAVLEDLLESSKPKLQAAPRLHYLLRTPFRYPPLRHGSRFSTRELPSLWYGSVRPTTAFAETAYYRLLFLEGTRAKLEPLTAELSLFAAKISTSRGVDLCREPFDRHVERLASPNDYGATQQLGREMREDGVDAFRYPSARDRPAGVNVGLFNPSAFATARPERMESWHSHATREGVEFTRRDPLQPKQLRYERERFLVDGELPSGPP